MKKTFALLACLLCQACWSGDINYTNPPNGWNPISDGLNDDTTWQITANQRFLFSEYTHKGYTVFRVGEKISLSNEFLAIKDLEKDVVIRLCVQLKKDSALEISSFFANGANSSVACSTYSEGPYEKSGTTSGRVGLTYDTSAAPVCSCGSSPTSLELKESPIEDGPSGEARFRLIVADRDDGVLRPVALPVESNWTPFPDGSIPGLVDIRSVVAPAGKTIVFGAEPQSLHSMTVLFDAVKGVRKPSIPVEGQPKALAQNDKQIFVWNEDSGYFFDTDQETASAISAANGPALPKDQDNLATAVWAKDSVFVWAVWYTTNPTTLEKTYHSTGKIYAANAWTDVALTDMAPKFGLHPQSAWDGTHIVIWAEGDAKNTASYDLVKKEWQPIKQDMGLTWGRLLTLNGAVYLFGKDSSKTHLLSLEEVNKDDATAVFHQAWAVKRTWESQIFLRSEFVSYDGVHAVSVPGYFPQIDANDTSPIAFLVTPNATLDIAMPLDDLAPSYVDSSVSGGFGRIVRIKGCYKGLSAECTNSYGGVLDLSGIHF